MHETGAKTALYLPVIVNGKQEEMIVQY